MKTLPAVFGKLESNSERLTEKFEKMMIKNNVEAIQITALLKTARISNNFVGFTVTLSA